MTNKAENAYIAYILAMSGKQYVPLHCHDNKEEGKWSCASVVDETIYWRKDMQYGYWSRCFALRKIIYFLFFIIIILFRLEYNLLQNVL